ncbi:MAG: Gfo/Idh/MocA family oxidoreductase [Verrucomicrobia bacterium]|nr:Gfo/Idh/MocA family oxidoreductase [Verrucomicrobiota bacterium]
MSIRVGVAGAGSMGRNHARVYGLLEDVELTAVYDQDRGRAEAVVAEFGGTVVGTLEELAACCDAVSVVVPTEAHLAVGGELLDRGVSVLVEKPIAFTEKEAEALVLKATETGRILQVGHIERFNPVLRELEKQLTHPKFIEAHRLSPFPNRSMDIGVVLDLMIHDLEVILHLVRSPIASIDAVGVAVLTRHEDIANARIRFENGCVANITASRISPDRMRKIRVFQEECYLSLDYQEQKGKIYYREGAQISCKEVEVEKDEPLKLELGAFVESVREKKTPTVTGQQGAAALEVALEITRLIQAGNAAG